MKKTILSLITLNLISSIAAADINVGTYQGRTNTWLGGLTAKTCILEVSKHPHSEALIYKMEVLNSDGTTAIESVLNTAPGKLKSEMSADGHSEILSYDELTPGLRIQALIKLTGSSVVWNTKTTIPMMKKTTEVSVDCIALEKVN